MNDIYMTSCSNLNPYEDNDDSDLAMSENEEDDDMYEMDDFSELTLSR